MRRYSQLQSVGSWYMNWNKGIMRIVKKYFGLALWSVLGVVVGLIGSRFLVESKILEMNNRFRIICGVASDALGSCSCISNCLEVGTIIETIGDVQINMEER